MIDRFEYEYRFLSNFAPSVIKWKYLDRYWTSPTLEHAFQASKALKVWECKFVNNSPDPRTAKKRGRKVRAGEWDARKYDVMKALLIMKFEQNPDLREKLIETGDHELIEGNWWHDTDWGICTGTARCRYGPHDAYGENNLGKQLMEVREALA